MDKNTRSLIASTLNPREMEGIRYACECGGVFHVKAIGEDIAMWQLFHECDSCNEKMSTWLYRIIPEWRMGRWDT